MPLKVRRRRPLHSDPYGVTPLPGCTGGRACASAVPVRAGPGREPPGPGRAGEYPLRTREETNVVTPSRDPLDARACTRAESIARRCWGMHHPIVTIQESRSGRRPGRRAEPRGLSLPGVAAVLAAGTLLA